MNKQLKKLITVITLFLTVVAFAQKPRLIITTDIGGDPDDEQSMVRLLVHSNEFELEGLIASASGTPGELGEDITHENIINDMIGLYAQVENNLRIHDADFPTSSYLYSITKSGNSSRGWSAVGSGHDTEGSSWIISVVDQPDSRPVNISIWGGQTDLAQALWKVKSTRSTSEYNTFISKIRIHDIADQDGIFSNIIAEHPNLFYVLNKAQSGVSCESVFRGMFLGGDLTLVTKSWINNNVKTNHGALGGYYPLEDLWTCGNGINGLKEGDTPSWFYFLNDGIQNPGTPWYGGWGGRFELMSGGYYQDAMDNVDGDLSRIATVYRWREEFNNAFAARMDWCIKSYSNANHFPIAKISNDGSKDIININGEAGSQVSLSAAGSSDSDGNSLSYKWFYYKEPGNYNGTISISNSTSQTASASLPSDFGDGKTAHIILQVTDNGTPNLTSYRRVIISGQNGAPVSLITSYSDNFDNNSISSDWQITGNFPTAETNNRIEVNTANSTSSWLGGGVFLTKKFDLSSTLVYELDVTKPDLSANQWEELIVTPALSFDSEGQPLEFVRIGMRAANLIIGQKINGTYSSLNEQNGVLSSGTANRIKMEISEDVFAIFVNDVEIYSGSHNLTNLSSGGYIGFRAANRDDASGGTAKFDNYNVYVKGGSTPDPTVITSPSLSTVFTPGQSVTATGTGGNLSWNIDVHSDGLGAIATGSGGTISFTVPSNCTSDQVVRVTLNGDAGSVTHEYAIEEIAPVTYTLTVTNGSGDGAYTAGTVVSVSANAAPAGQQFDTWSGDVSIIDNANNASALVTMPAHNVNVIATYKDVVEVPAGLIMNVVTNSSNTYLRAENLSIGDEYYTDRTYVINSLPDELIGAEYIKTPNNDKSLSGDDVLSFELTDEATVYVAYDSRHSNIPSWLDDYTEAGWIITTSDTPLNVYAKTFSAGAVTFGGNSQTVDCSNYFVIAVAGGEIIPTYTVTFTILDGLTPVSGADVEFNGVTQTTDASGMVTFTNVPQYTDISYTVSAIGFQSHTVDISVMNNMDKTVVMETQATDVADEQLGITVYPNPAIAFVNVTNLNHAKTIQIFNAVGQLVIEQNVNSANMQLDLKDLKSGIYYINIIHEQSVETKMLIVK